MPTSSIAINVTPAPRWAAHEAVPPPAVPTGHLNQITTLLSMIRRGKPGDASTITDYLFGYAWALQDARLIDRFQEGVISELSQSALRHSGQPGFRINRSAQGSPSCQDQT